MSRNLLICRYVLELHHSTLNQVSDEVLQGAYKSYTTLLLARLAKIYYGSAIQKIHFELNQNTMANIKLKQHLKVYHLSTALS